MCIYIYIYTYVCVYIYIYTHTYHMKDKRACKDDRAACFDVDLYSVNRVYGRFPT